jgi:Bacterial regulatory helix-turn-helix protein, lysR family
MNDTDQRRIDVGNDIDLKWLRSFVVVAEDLHFTRAADRLFVSQPALSKQIGMLERQLGARLFERGRDRVRLTPVGTALLPHGRLVLAKWDRAWTPAGKPPRIGDEIASAEETYEALVDGRGRLPSGLGKRSADRPRGRGDPPGQGYFIQLAGTSLAGDRLPPARAGLRTRVPAGHQDHLAERPDACVPGEPVTPGRSPRSSDAFGDGQYGELGRGRQDRAEA